MGLFNATCPLPKDAIDAKNAEKPIIGNVTFQHLEFYIAAGFSCVCVTLMFFVAVSHLSCYVRPREQRQIIRICFYPVTFAICSAFSIFSYPVSIYAQPAAAIYEPVSLAAIFFLFVEFSAGNPENRESLLLRIGAQATDWSTIRQEEMDNWIWRQPSLVSGICRTSTIRKTTS